MASPEQTETGKEGLTPQVYTVTPEATVWEAAELMRRRGVGDLVVVEDLKPVGILTDRDIVLRVTAAGLSPLDVAVQEIMSAPPVTAPREMEIGEGIALMARHGIRRLPIVDEDGKLASILTLDDILLLQLDDAREVRNIVQRQLSLGDAPASPLRSEPPIRLSRSIGSMARAAVIPPATVEVWHGLRSSVQQPGYVHAHRHPLWKLRFWLIIALVALIVALIISPYPLVPRSEQEMTIDDIEAIKRSSREPETPDLRSLQMKLKEQQPPEIKEAPQAAPAR
jgi:CBS domain-containing protein